MTKSAPPGQLGRLALITVLFSAVGLFAKLIHQPALAITFGRGLVAWFTLLIVIQWARRDGRHVPPLTSRRALALIVLGVLGAMNWGFFFLAIQASTVAVAVVSLFTYPLITAILEPLINRHEKHSAMELLASLAVIVGVALTVRLGTSGAPWLGVFYGVLAGLSFAIRNIFSRRLLQGISSGRMMLWQFGVAAVMFSPFIVVQWQPWSVGELVMMPILGALLTAWPQWMFVDCLNHVTARLASLVVSMQPVIASFLAWIVLGERPTWWTAAGAGVILAAVGTVTLYRRRAVKQQGSSEFIGPST
jgi:drug/metabolite transporter (DMT)-like permease